MLGTLRSRTEKAELIPKKLIDEALNNYSHSSLLLLLLLLLPPSSMLAASEHTDQPESTPRHMVWLHAKHG